MSEQPDKQRRNRLISRLINLAGVLALIAILYLGGVDAWRQIVQADLLYLLAAFVATVVWNLCAAYRWALIARQVSPQAAECPYRYFFTYQMLGMLTGQVVPISVGMLGTRPVALNLSRGVSLKRAALSVFLDKLFDVVLAVLLVIPVAVYLAGWIGLPLALGLMGGAALAGALAIGWKYDRALQIIARIGSRAARLLARLPLLGPRLARRLPEQLDRLATETVLPNRLAAQVFALTVLQYALVSARMYTIAQALHLEIPWYLMAMGACVTQLTLIFSVTPGSLGFLEAGWGAVLGLAGLSSGQIYTFLIGRRAFVLLFTVANTLMAFAWIRESPARLFRAVMSASRRSPRGADAPTDG
jgi:uncharacterized protein (TIRG00374 family)